MGNSRASGNIAAVSAAVLALGLAACDEGRSTPEDAGTPPLDASLDATDATMADAQPDATHDARVDTGAPDAAGDAAVPRDASGDADDGAVVDPELCPAEQQVADGCMSLANAEGIEGLCDGLDNDCNGLVDESCVCVPGEVQSCFAGPPGRADIGACASGTQVCMGFEFPTWGPCEGGSLPGPEQCDGVDNDCNGCTDEIEQCVNIVDCPVPGDPRVGTAQPFTTHTFDADQFVDPTLVESYRWRVSGTPCDRMFRSLGARNGQLSYQLRNARSAHPEVDLTLSGEYAVSVDLALVNGETVTCNFPLQVGAQGLRVELCWPESGPSSPGGDEIDLDLHLGREGSTQQWNDDDDCHYANCKTLTQQLPDGGMPEGLWGAAASPRDSCTGVGLSDAVNQFVTYCPNPRLDVDSFQVEDSRYPTENINLDRVGNNQSYRVAVINRDCNADEDCRGRVAHPLVNVYCDAHLAGSFELAEGEVDHFGAGNAGDPVGGMRDVWRVVDVHTTRTGGQVSCDLVPLTDDAGSGPSIEAGGDAGSLPY